MKSRVITYTGTVSCLASTETFIFTADRQAMHVPFYLLLLLLLLLLLPLLPLLSPPSPPPCRLLSLPSPLIYCCCCCCRAVAASAVAMVAASITCLCHAACHGACHAVCQGAWRTRFVWFMRRMHANARAREGQSVLGGFIGFGCMRTHMQSKIHYEKSDA